MRLPEDNSLSLDPGNDDVVDAADVVALTDADVLALLPSWVRRSPTRLRDAMVQQARRFWTRLQHRVGRVLGALQSPRNATGLGLAAHGDARQRAAAPGESEADYRERLLVRPARITPNAIRAAVTALVLARTPVPPVLFEPGTEGVFVQDADDPDPAWCCFYQSVEGPLLWADMPDNPIRAGVWLVSEAELSKPLFVVLIEGPLYDLDAGAVVLSEAQALAGEDGYYLGEDAGPVAFSYLSSEVPPLEDQVLREVEARRGAGVLWWLMVIPNLGGAL